MGGDRNTARSAGVAPYFNPRLPDGRRPLTTRQTIPPTTFQSTPPGWEATTAQRRHMQRHPISIHASRMGGDHRRCDSRVESGDISIHASRMGGDSLSFAGSSPQSKFQSTPPGWEATHQHGQPDDRGDISIHASRMGGDRNSFGIFTHAVDFNPRLPDGRRPTFGAS